MGVFNKSGKLVAGDPKNFQPIVEYYVLQRMISKPKDSHWQLYSKISPQSVEEILKN
jgi:predicted lipid-binding transport protein (Tim44 family)